MLEPIHVILIVIGTGTVVSWFMKLIDKLEK